jgi:hypothetical protein
MGQQEKVKWLVLCLIERERISADPGSAHDPKTLAAPVTNNMTIQIVMILMIMATWFGKLLEVKGAFLHGQFGECEKPLHMYIPQGLEQFYPLKWILRLLKRIYGLCQSASAFW